MPEYEYRAAREEHAAIKKAVRRAASDLLHAKDADTALSYYVPGATVASNGFLYPSFDAFSTDIRAFYDALRQIDLAVWDDLRVEVLRADAAALTATFRWRSTDTAGACTDLRGVWSAVFVRDNDCWRIRARHESFAPATT